MSADRTASRRLRSSSWLRAQPAQIYRLSVDQSGLAAAASAAHTAATQADTGEKKKKKKRKRKKDKLAGSSSSAAAAEEHDGPDLPDDGIEVGAAAYGLGGVVSTGDGSGGAATKLSKQERKAQRAAEKKASAGVSGVVGVKVAAGKDSGGGGGAAAASAVPAKPVAVAAPMFAAQLALGMGGTSGWD